MTRTPSLPSHLEQCSITRANRLYDTHECESLVITGWDDTDVIAGQTADTAVLIENALTPNNTRYYPVTSTALPR